MARGGAGAKVVPSLAGMGEPPAGGGSGRAGARRGTRQGSEETGDGAAEVRRGILQAPLPPRSGPAGRERSPGGSPHRESPPAEFRRPPTRLKVPRPLAVEADEDPDGPAPRWVTWRGTRRAVATVEDDWRVDDEWWRDEVSRHYFAVTLADGCRLTLFLDRLAGTWWEQRC